MTPTELGALSDTVTSMTGYGLEYWWRAQPVVFSMVGILIVATLIATAVGILFRR